MTQITNQNRPVAGNLNLGNVNAQSLTANAKLIDSTLKLMNAAQAQLGKAIDKAEKADQMGKALPGKSTTAATNCFPTQKPNPTEATDPNASLRVENGKITTPGGYTIEPVGQFEWKITGPDKMETRVWGDPHVDESDGGRWDFKKNTEFVLGDGTRINCTCVPYGNGATVTGKLDIINANSHIEVKDIDKGKGKIGPILNDGDDAIFNFMAEGAETITMGKTTADWNYEGREITGSDNQGETQKTKEESNTTQAKWQSAFASPAKSADTLKDVQGRFDSVQQLFASMKNTQALGFNPFRKADDLNKYDRGQHLDGMKSAFKSMTSMIQTLQRMSELNSMLRSRGTNIA